MKKRHGLISGSKLKKTSNLAKGISIRKQAGKGLTRKVKGTIIVRNRKSTGKGDGTGSRGWKKPKQNTESKNTEV